MTDQSTYLLTTALAGLIAAPALAQENPFARPDDSWISISGTVAAPTSDAFVLDYGDGVITVEMDDWDSYGDAYGLLDGDNVTVYGRIDDDVFEARTIEASSVYVENLNTYFYASAADEEGGVAWSVSSPVIPGRTTLRGTVTETEPAEQAFSLSTGDQVLAVETEDLGYDPLDDIGYQQIDTGDRVSVTGRIGREFVDGRVFEADVLVTLQDETPAGD